LSAQRASEWFLRRTERVTGTVLLAINAGIAIVLLTIDVVVGIVVNEAISISMLDAAPKS
jgi:hypothetical protein